MPSVTLNDITIAFGDRRILGGVNFSISKGSRMALTGANGSGKSTLLKIIAGLTPTDSGGVHIEKNTRVSYLPQSGVPLTDTTLRQEVETVYDEMLPVIEELKEVEKALGGLKEGSPEADSLLEKHHQLHERILESEYYSREAAISRILKGLGFSEADYEKKTSAFSGGWQMRIALTKVLLEHPDILLLDEPTNYLDLEARNWLEAFLNDFTGGFLIVSHDRFFLDSTVTQVAEVFQRKISVYKGNFSQYEIKREQELAALIEAYKRQQEEVEKLESFIRKFRYNSSKAKLVQSRIKFLEKMELIEKPPGWRSISFSFPPAPHSGQNTLRVENIGKSYGENRVLHDVEFELTRGEKLVLVGPNGAGKSTLMGILSEKVTADSGKVIYGTDVITGYFCQDALDSFTGPQSILEEVESGAPTELIPTLRSLLGAFLFTGDDVYKPLSVLSGGEKNRVALLKLLLHPANLLMLDEPTNHLDMTSKNILLEALKKFEGTLIFVSHDRYFIDNLATRVLEVVPGEGIKLYPGDYAYYLWKKEQQIQGEAEQESQEVVKVSDGKLAREEEKKRKAALNRLVKEEQALLEKMESLDEAFSELEKSMTLEENYMDGEKMKKIKEKISLNRKENELLLKDWEILEEQLQEYKG